MAQELQRRTCPQWQVLFWENANANVLGFDAVSERKNAEQQRTGSGCLIVRLSLIHYSFSPEDRKENLRRVAYVAKIFNENGNLVIASFVSPANELQQMVRNIIGNFKLIYAKCSLKTCEKRDTKGMYKKARKGDIKQFTGISAPFEEPTKPDIVVDTENNDVEECVKQILNAMRF